MDPNISQQQAVEQNLLKQSVPQQQVSKQEGGNKKKMSIIVSIFFALAILTILGIVLFVRGEKEATVPKITPPQTPSPTEAITGISYENIRLILNQPTLIPNSNIELTYLGKAEANCPDCYGSTKIKIVVGREEAIIDYFCGGIIGECSASESVLGYEVELIENFDPNQIVVTVRKI